MISVMRKAFLLIITLLIVLFPGLVKAQSESTPSPKIKVERVASVIERLKERVDLLFKFSTKDKISLQQQLTEKRLAELDYVIKSGQGDMIEEVSSRYKTHVGKLIKSTKSAQSKEIKTQLLDMGENHLTILAPLRDNFESNSGFWLLVQQDIDVEKEFSDQIRSP